MEGSAGKEEERGAGEGWWKRSPRRNGGWGVGPCPARPAWLPATLPRAIACFARGERRGEERREEGGAVGGGGGGHGARAHHFLLYYRPAAATPTIIARVVNFPLIYRLI